LEVWGEQGEGDYDYGPSFICVACGVEFTIQGPYALDPNKKNHAFGRTEPDAHNQQLEQLRAVVEMASVEEHLDIVCDIALNPRNR
jgi:hypothetical protein